MATVDELLNATTESQVCTIDPDTRVITVPSCYKEFGVEADEKVNRINFQCPKVVGDNIDLTTFNLYINYMNASGQYNAYLVDDVAVSGDNITFSWLLSRHVTEKSGTVNYIVCAKKSDDTGVVNEWNTKVATGTVGVGLEATTEVEEQNADVIEQILANVVRCTEQTFTDEQKLQARKNIDVVGPYFDWTPITFSYALIASMPQYVNTATVYIGRGTLFPVDMAAATDELQEAWRKFQSVRLNGFGETDEAVLQNLQYIYTLCQNGVFGENFTTDGAENRIIILGSISKTGGYYEVTSKLSITSYTVSGLDWLTVVFTTNLRSQSIRYNPREKTIVFYGFHQSLRTNASEKSISSPSLSQTLMSAAPTEEMHIATKKYVDDSIKSIPSTQIDGATVVQAPKYVNSVDEMTDVSRPYVLISTGHIWANADVEVETTLTDTLTATDDNPYYDGYRLGSDATTDSMTHDATGYFLTPLIDLTQAKYQGQTIQIHLEGAHFASSSTYETWIQARPYGTDKTVLANRWFVFEDATNSNNIAYYSNGTISITYNSDTSATISITVPPTYNSTTIGYLRFCAKGTVADSKITVTYTGTSTGVQWFDTGTAYGSTDAQLSAKVAELNNEGSTPTTYNLLGPAVIEYYNKAAYSDSDYSTTNIVRASLPYRADIPQPVTLKWQHNEDAVRTIISINTGSTVLSTSMKQYDATGFDNYPIYNLLPNTTYYYQVTHMLADGSLVTAKSGSFTTSSIPWRFIKVDGCQNIRDLGGWAGLGGQKVKYGKIFRGAALDDSTFRDMIITGNGKREMVSMLGIRADLDLRYNYTESAISMDMTYLCAPYGSYAQSITTADYRTTFKTILEWIVTQLSASSPKPIYFHCQGGCDRTGTLAFILMGLLGLSESDLAREYELSSFSPIGMYDRIRNSTVYGYSAMVAALKTYSGDTITEKFVDFATTGCGVSSDTINSFRTLMLE